MSNQIILQGMTPDELGVIVADAFKKQVEALKETLAGSTQENDLLTREEAAKFLSINSSTLWSYTNSGKLTAHSIGSRRYYKRSELLEALTKVSVK